MRILNLEPDGYSQQARAILEGIGEYTEDWQDNSAEAVIVRLWHEVNDRWLSEFPNLKYIVSATTGLDHIDLEACKERGIQVLSLKGETDFLRTVPATAELTWGLILSLTRRIPYAFESVKGGRWERDDFKGHDLRGKTLGIVGVGRIGSMVAEYGKAFGMRVIGYDNVFPAGVEMYDSMNEVLTQSDIVSIHVSLNEETKGMIGVREFMNMKPTGLLINTSRGGVIDEDELYIALKYKVIAGAALDVMDNERGIRHQGLLDYARNHDNLIITPHIGGCTQESMEATEIYMARKLAEISRN